MFEIGESDEERQNTAQSDIQVFSDFGQVQEEKPPSLDWFFYNNTFIS